MTPLLIAITAFKSRRQPSLIYRPNNLDLALSYALLSELKWDMSDSFVYKNTNDSS